VPHTIYHTTHINLLPNTLQQSLQLFILSLGIIASLVILWGNRNDTLRN
jgi:TRAP-type C4-dicarboxylate transport system permease small subunit